MNKKTTLLGGVLAAALLCPGMASASFLLDTGTPSNPSAFYTLDSGHWAAAEFKATGGEDVTSLAAFLTEPVGSSQSGYTFTFDIYSASGITARNRSPIAAFTGTYTQDGWNTSAVNWTVPTDGDYWLAVQVNTTNQAGTLNLPQEASALTGTAPAEAFAYYGGSLTGGVYKTAGAPAVGLEVSVVPLPPGFWLFASGLLGLGAFAGRQRIRYFFHNSSAATTGIHAAA
jgi:hypothetical protein